MSEGADHTLSSTARQLSLFLAFFLCTVGAVAAPKVLVFIVVDQFLPGYLDDSYSYTGGLKKLREESAWFTNAHHEHVPTETAPGHATLITGAPPSQTGIISNDWYDRKTGKKVLSTDVEVLVPTVGNRLKDKDPRAKVVVVSGKKRSTWAMAGKNADHKSFHFLRSDAVVAEETKKAITEWKVGEDEVPDLVAISFSMTDLIGHKYGPESAQMNENLVELDKTLGELFSFFEEKFGRGGFVVTLSADHGVLPLSRAKRLDKRKLQKQIEEALRSVCPTEEKPLLNMALPDLYLGAACVLSLEEAKAAVNKVPGIAHVYAPPFKDNDEFSAYYRRSYFPERSGDLIVRLKKNHITLSTREGTGHGSPYDYDTHVPILLWGTALKPGQYGRRISTMDLAPTVTTLLEIPFVSEGKSLIEPPRK